MAKLFDLNAVIENANKQTKKTFHLNKTWGLYYLRAENLSMLNDSTDILQRAAHYQPHFIDERAQIRKQIHEIKLKNGTSNIFLLNQVTKKLINNKTLWERAHWEERMAKNLNDPLTWSSFMLDPQVTESTAKQKHIAELQQWWNTHQYFTKHSSAALLWLLYHASEYNTQVELALQELTKHKKSRFNFRKLPALVADEYQKFLQQRAVELSALCSLVSNEMNIRLQVASRTQQVTHDDITLYIMQQLQQLGVNSLEVASGNNFALHGLSAQVFFQAHRAIEKLGNEELKRSLKQLKWIESGQQKGSSITIVTWQDSFLLVPATLKIFMPTKLGWPRWLFNLFTDRQERVQFFQERQQLFANLAQPIILETESLSMLQPLHPAFQQYVERFTLLQQEIACCNQNEKNSKWRQGRNKLQQRWQIELHTYFSRAQNQGMLWLRMLSNTINENPDIHNDNKRCAQLWNTVNQLAALLLPAAEEVERIQITKLHDRLAEQLKQGPLSQLNLILEQGSKNHPITAVQKNYVLEMLKQMLWRDAGLLEKEKLVPLFKHQYGTRIALVLLPKIKQALKLKQEYIEFHQDLELLMLLGNDNELKLFQRYIINYLIDQSSLLSLLDAQSGMEKAQALYDIANHYAGEELKPDLYQLEIHLNDKNWLNFRAAYQDLVGKLSDRLVQHKANKFCKRLQQVCDTDLAVFAAGKPPKKLAKNDKFNKIIELKASVNFFNTKINNSITVTEKKHWLDLLGAAVLAKAPQYSTLVNKYH